MTNDNYYKRLFGPNRSNRKNEVVLPTEITKTLETQAKPGMIYLPQAQINVFPERELQGKNWEETHKELYEQNKSMLTLNQFREFLQVTRDNHPELYQEITEVRDPYRANWIDAKFQEKDSGLYLLTNHTIINGELKPQTQEQLQDNLTEDKRISLDDWINNPTTQGLPRESTGDLYYWAPVKDKVARFSACSDWAYLVCDRDPGISGSWLGVFASDEVAKP